MIVHIHDEQSIFIQHAIYCFKQAGIPSKHVIIGKAKNYAKQSNDYNYIQWSAVEYHQFIRDFIPQCSLVILHGLIKTNESTLLDILKAKIKKPPIAWVLFGTEIQNWKIFPSHFLGPKTRILYYTLIPYRILIPLYRFCRRLFFGSAKQKLHKIDFFSHFIPGEMDFIYQHTGIKKPMLWHTYAILENYIEPSLKDCTVCNAINILIVNSSSFTSNHIEAFDILKNLPLEDREIMVPLSYGNKTYQKYIVKKGVRYFGNQFRPLTEFVSKEVYHSILLGCSVMILNHYRQQALGNLVFAAWAGMRIYIRKTTSTFKYFKEKGLILFSVEDDLNNNNPNVFLPLNEEEIKQNRQVLSTVFGRENVIAKLRESFLPFLDKSESDKQTLK
ncbi:MAG TPA: TDP-N-acetylfucosamine:lipid II N-acetylfucosaminyltransferase [Bacteroidales bacterium]|nr:TDP-N-acetylfucosamine:lipid II N-acetylfucosaminyltransferase [Bacteroidales bacterium]